MKAIEVTHFCKTQHTGHEIMNTLKVTHFWSTQQSCECTPSYTSATHNIVVVSTLQVTHICNSGHEHIKLHTSVTRHSGCEHTPHFCNTQQWPWNHIKLHTSVTHNSGQNTHQVTHFCNTQQWPEHTSVTHLYKTQISEVSMISLQVTHVPRYSPRNIQLFAMEWLVWLVAWNIFYLYIYVRVLLKAQNKSYATHLYNTVS